MTTNMVDVSSNNHHTDAPFDWKAAKAAGYGAAMIKATEGANYVNPWLERDAIGAHEADFLLGYYHYAHPSESSAPVQCNNFWQHVKALPRSLGLALDFEVAEHCDALELRSFGSEFIARIPHAVEQKVIYSDPAFLAEYGIDVSADLWIASWGKRPRQKVWAWQSGAAMVPGLSEGSTTDVGLFFG